ncbi:anti-FecI sigma factor, FecR [Paenibacillus amylolyticus]|uniref:Anti-FecI sigma factor, FecR n=1 Tax=Paenibacillus amylolyticus TaxID=1451 RepID=A0A100VSN2_PAEAM|nr:anti-FecI sigma factor, FecR [Paenibacillus amylolyticus]
MVCILLYAHLNRCLLHGGHFSLSCYDGGCKVIREDEEKYIKVNGNYFLITGVYMEKTSNGWG